MSQNIRNGRCGRISAIKTIMMVPYTAASMAVGHLIEDHAETAKLPLRFAANKAIEGDHLILEKLQLDENEKEMLEHIVCQMETERGVDRSAAIADMRFDFIERLCEQTVVKPKESKERIRSEKIDRILTENIRQSLVLL